MHIELKKVATLAASIFSGVVVLFAQAETDDLSALLS